MSVSDEEAHHPLSTEIVTVLSHLVTRACWGMEAKAEGGEDDMTWEKLADKVWNNWVSHWSGSSEEYEDNEKKYEGKLENELTEANVEVEANITHCEIHAKLNTWVIHHP